MAKRPQAGGDTFRDPVAEPQPGFRSRAYVFGPSAGGWPKVALVTQVRVPGMIRTGIDGAGSAPPDGRKKRKGTELVLEI